MSRRRWIASPPGPDENRRAALLAAGVAGVLGAVLFYLARIFLARERIAPPPGGRSRSRAAHRARATSPDPEA